MWVRIWTRWKDKSLCFEWYKYRYWYSLKAWEYAFTQLAKNQNSAIAKNETPYNPAGWVRGVARRYDAEPQRYIAQAPPSAKCEPTVKPTIASEDKRRWYYAYTAKKAENSRLG